MPYGAIYIAQNPRDGANTFKVGKTERTVDERMKELTSSTSNLGAYTARAYFVVFDIDAAEQACHRALQRYRIQDNREFFEIPFSRLIRILAEQTQPYAARNLVPEQQEDEQAPEQLSATELLKSARERRRNIDQLWDQALAAAAESTAAWETQIHDKALAALKELKGEENLRWTIPSPGRSDKAPNWRVPICSATVVSLFSKKPLILSRHGLRGGIYGDLDLSKAIGEPEIQRSGDHEFVKWKEPDDGRIGRIELATYVENAMPDDRERGIRPLPKIDVRATAIRYDDYHQGFEEKLHCSKSYNDPAEAFEVFLELVVENAKVPQYDVRQRDRDYRGRDRILDRGKFEMRLLEKEAG